MEKLLILIPLLIGPLLFKGEEPDSLNNLTINTVFYEIQDTTEVEHWFRDLREGDIYCYLHDAWENVEIIK
tara:strand:+ start:705 stop:917 length:213 start_codon:yes stop_codon:yes gene_type:complete